MDKSSPIHRPTNTPSETYPPSEGKTVAFSAESIAAANARVRSPVTEKILARKPTPCNSDLAAAIRNSGFGQQDQPQSNQPVTHPQQQHNPQDSPPNTECSEQQTPSEPVAHHPPEASPSH